MTYIVNESCINRAFRLANTAIDAFVRVDNEHVLAFIEAVDWTYFDTVHVLTFDTALIDDVRHLSVLPEDWASTSGSSNIE